MVRKQYRRLTPNERHYLIEHYADDPQVINAIAIQLKLEPPKVLEHARYLKLRVPNSRHAWTEAELMLHSIPNPELSCNSVGQKSNVHFVDIWIGGFHISLIYSQGEHLGVPPSSLYLLANGSNNQPWSSP